MGVPLHQLRAFSALFTYQQVVAIATQSGVSVSRRFRIEYKWTRFRFGNRVATCRGRADRWLELLFLRADRVAPDRFRPGARTDPYVPALEPTVPQIMVSLRA